MKRICSQRVNPLAENTRLGTIDPEPMAYNFYLRHGRVVRQSDEPTKPKFRWAQVIESRLNGFYDTRNERGRWWIEIAITSAEPRVDKEIIRTRKVPTVVEMEDGWLAIRVMEVKQQGENVRVFPVRITESIQRAIRRAGTLLVDRERYRAKNVRKLRIGEPQETFPEEINMAMKKWHSKRIVDTKKVRELKWIASRAPRYFLQEVMTSEKFKKGVNKLSERRARVIAQRIVKEYGKTWWAYGPEKSVKPVITGKPLFEHGMFKGMISDE